MLVAGTVLAAETVSVPAWMVWGIPLVSVIAVVWLIHAIGLTSGRVRALRRLAERDGMTFSDADPAGIGELRFATFRGSKGVLVTNVVSLSLGPGNHARAFDYACWDEREEQSSDRDALESVADEMFGFDGRRDSRTTRVYADTRSGAVVRVGAFLAPLVATPAGWMWRALETAGLPDIDFESEEFNRGWDVRCGDRRFATLFFDAQMIDLILTLEQKVAIETFGNYVLFTAKRCSPERLVSLAHAAARVPNILSTLIVDEYPTVAAMESRAMSQAWQARPNGKGGWY
jgi:hypothetical protein